MARSADSREDSKGLGFLDDKDAGKEVLMYLFIDETDMDVEEVYSLVFAKGKKIKWQ